MKAGAVEIVLVVDRSGSMSTTKQDAEGGLRHFLEGQRSVPGEARLTLYRFNDSVERVFEARPIGEVRDHELVIEPTGMTALLDAMATAIDEVGARLAKTPEDERPSKVFVVTVTDGEENRSHRFTHKDVFDRVSKQRDQFKWEFVFIGANQDAIKTGAQLGIMRDSAITYAATARGTQAAYGVVGQAVMSARVGGRPIAFSQADRTSALGQDDDAAVKSQVRGPRAS
jgi:Mg-chelatase subunit ChlD